MNQQALWNPSQQLRQEIQEQNLCVLCTACLHGQCMTTSVRLSVPCLCRLKVMRSFGLVNTPPEPVFDHFTETIATIFKCPFAAMCLVHEEHVYVKSGVGEPHL